MNPAALIEAHAAWDQIPAGLRIWLGAMAVGGVIGACSGGSVFLVSTDPASNLDEMLGITLSVRASAFPGAASLMFAKNWENPAV